MQTWRPSGYGGGGGSGSGSGSGGGGGGGGGGSGDGGVGEKPVIDSCISGGFGGGDGDWMVPYLCALRELSMPISPVVSSCCMTLTPRGPGSEKGRHRTATLMVAIMPESLCLE